MELSQPCRSWEFDEQSGLTVSNSTQAAVRSAHWFASARTIRWCCRSYVLGHTHHVSVPLLRAGDNLTLCRERLRFDARSPLCIMDRWNGWEVMHLGSCETNVSQQISWVIRTYGEWKSKSWFALTILACQEFSPTTYL